MTEELINSESSLSVEWSDPIKGGKAVRLSGIFDKLNYRVRKALSVKSVKCSFSTAHCILKSEGVFVANMHFLIQKISRDIPVATGKSAAEFKNENSPVSLQEQKEIYLLPTVRMTNLLHSEIDVLLSETGKEMHALKIVFLFNTELTFNFNCDEDQSNQVGYENIGKQATISCGSTVEFYANPAVIYFTVTLTACKSSSKPVNSGDCVKKLLKQSNDLQHLDIYMAFDGGNFFATLRLYRGNRGMLEVIMLALFSLRSSRIGI